MKMISMLTVSVLALSSWAQANELICYQTKANCVKMLSHQKGEGNLSYSAKLDAKVSVDSNLTAVAENNYDLTTTLTNIKTGQKVVTHKTVGPNAAEEGYTYLALTAATAQKGGYSVVCIGNRNPSISYPLSNHIMCN